MAQPTLKELLDRGAKLYAAGHSAAAADIYRKALEIAPDDPTARLRHAIAIWHGEDRAEEALAEIRDLAKAYPQAAVLAQEGLILNSLGRFGEGAAAARRAVTADPGYSSAWLDLATGTPAEGAGALAEELRGLLAKGPTPKVARDLNYALAQCLRKTGEAEAAFEACSEGNRLSQNRWDEEREAAFHSILREMFDAGLIERLRDQGSPDERMVFLSGMPRSGTTLLDRMLSAHPIVESVGETTTVGSLFNQLFAQTGKTAAGAKAALTGPVLNQMAQACMKQIKHRMGDKQAARIIDKMPANTLFWPLIAILFPKAHILHIERHPLGTCLSCWEASFAFGLDYATDMTTLGQAYRQYADLTDHWQALLGHRVHRVLYEDLVSMPEPVLRKAVQHLGLPWDARCLSPDSSGPIKTASVAQARAPVNTGSVARWEAYRDRLDPVVRAMGGQDWLDTRWQALRASHASAHD